MSSFSCCCLISSISSAVQKHGYASPCLTRLLHTFGKFLSCALVIRSVIADFISFADNAFVSLNCVNLKTFEHSVNSTVNFSFGLYPQLLQKYSACVLSSKIRSEAGVRFPKWRYPVGLGANLVTLAPSLSCLGGYFPHSIQVFCLCLEKANQQVRQNSSFSHPYV